MTAALVTQRVPTIPRPHTAPAQPQWCKEANQWPCVRHQPPPATQNSHFLVWIISPSSPHNLITTHNLLMNGLDTAGQVTTLPRVTQPSPVARPARGRLVIRSPQQILFCKHTRQCRYIYISIHLSVSCLPLQPGCGRCAMQSMRSNS